MVVVLGFGVTACGQLAKEEPATVSMVVYLENRTDHVVELRDSRAGATRTAFIQPCEATMIVGRVWEDLSYSVDGTEVWRYDELPSRPIQDVHIVVTADAPIQVELVPKIPENAPLGGRCAAGG